MTVGRNDKGHFQKGHKLGGRPVGSRNRFTISMMDELMKGEDGQAEFHPMLEAKKLYRSTEDDRIKVSLLKEMLSFGNDKQFVEVQVEETDTPVTEETMLELYQALHERFGKVNG